jgi:hypothetical protein
MQLKMVDIDPGVCSNQPMSESHTIEPFATKPFVVGERVRVVSLPPYVKTAEPMPMLRPPDVIRVGEEGVILGRQPGGYWQVRLEKAAYLLDGQYLERVTPESSE